MPDFSQPDSGSRGELQIHGISDLPGLFSSLTALMIDQKREKAGKPTSAIPIGEVDSLKPGDRLQYRGRYMGAPVDADVTFNRIEKIGTKGLAMATIEVIYYLYPQAYYPLNVGQEIAVGFDELFRPDSG
jgi:hypothetical protein